MSEKYYYTADSAVIFGDVNIGEDASVWHNAVIRGDVQTITIGSGTNIQDGCILHVDAGDPLVIGENVTVGHGAILHGCTVGNNSLVGMGAIVLNGAVVGDNCMVAAGALVTKTCKIPDGALVLGSPAKAVRPLLENELDSLKESAESYIEHAKEQLNARPIEE